VFDLGKRRRYRVPVLGSDLSRKFASRRAGSGSDRGEQLQYECAGSVVRQLIHGRYSPCFFICYLMHIRLATVSDRPPGKQTVYT
jgi:hypothetical protein